MLITSVDWSPLWQSHHEIACRLAAAGNRLLFVENTGVRAPGARDTDRVWTRLRNRLRASSSAGLRRARPGLWVSSAAAARRCEVAESRGWPAYMTRIERWLSEVAG